MSDNQDTKRTPRWTVELEFGNVDFTPFAFFKVGCPAEDAEGAISKALFTLPGPFCDKVPDRVEAKQELFG